MIFPKTLNSIECPICKGNSYKRDFSISNHALWKCTGCELEFLYPQPDEAELASIYDRHYYDAWGFNTTEACVGKLKTLTFFRLLNKIQTEIIPGGNILDVGCATGYFLEVAQKMGFEPFGVELSSYGAEICRDKFGSNCIYEGILEKAEFRDYPEIRFNAIFMSDLLEHVKDPLSTLHAARRSLAPNGRLLITTPNAGSLLRRISGRNWLHYKTEHLFYFGTKNLEYMFAQTGFGETVYWPASKCLSIRYARYQFAVFGAKNKWLGHWLDKLPAGLLDVNLWVKLGEVTVMAKAI